MAKTAKSKSAKSKSAPPPEPAAAAPPIPTGDDDLQVAAPGAGGNHELSRPEVAPPRGLEEVDREDMVIPRFNIVQPGSEVVLNETGTAGRFRDAISGEEYEQLDEIVLLKVRKGRVFFAGDEDPEEGVVCASDDRVLPAARIERPVQDACAGCPMSEWRQIGNKRKHPKCQETYTLLIAHEGMPYFITLKSSAIKDVKKLLTQLRLKAGKERLDAFAYSFDVGLEMVKFDQGGAYMPRFVNVKRVSDDDYELYGAMFESFAHQAPTFDDAPDEAGGGDAGGAGAQGDFPFGENQS